MLYIPKVTGGTNEFTFLYVQSLVTLRGRYNSLKLLLTIL